jgi:hypothetical protein
MLAGKDWKDFQSCFLLAVVGKWRCCMQFQTHILFYPHGIGGTLQSTHDVFFGNYNELVYNYRVNHFIESIKLDCGFLPPSFIKKTRLKILTVESLPPQAIFHILKISGFWNTFSYNIRIKTCKITSGTSYSWATIWGASRNFTIIYHYIL